MAATKAAGPSGPDRSRSSPPGNYRARGVSAVGIDLITYHADFSTEERPLSLILVSDNNTPSDFKDDWGAYSIGPDNIPHVGDGWRSYDFAVPSQNVALPPGWSFIQFGSQAPPPDWSVLLTKVSQLSRQLVQPCAARLQRRCRRSAREGVRCGG